MRLLKLNVPGATVHPLHRQEYGIWPFSPSVATFEVQSLTRADIVEEDGSNEENEKHASSNHLATVCLRVDNHYAVGHSSKFSLTL